MQSLLVVSLAILAVIAVLAAMLARRGKKGIAAFTLPVCAIPVMHLVAALFQMNRWYARFDIAGMLIGVLLSILLSRTIPSGKPRRYYLVAICAFLAALLAGYLLY